MQGRGSRVCRSAESIATGCFSSVFFDGWAKTVQGLLFLLLACVVHQYLAAEHWSLRDLFIIFYRCSFGDQTYGNIHIKEKWEKSQHAILYDQQPWTIRIQTSTVCLCTHVHVCPLFRKYEIIDCQDVFSFWNMHQEWVLLQQHTIILIFSFVFQFPQKIFVFMKPDWLTILHRL